MEFACVQILQFEGLNFVVVHVVRFVVVKIERLVVVEMQNVVSEIEVLAIVV